MQSKEKHIDLKSLLPTELNQGQAIPPLLLFAIDAKIKCKLSTLERHNLWTNFVIPQRTGRSVERLLRELKKCFPAAWRLPSGEYIFLIWAHAAIYRGLTPQQQYDFWLNGGEVIPSDYAILAQDVIEHHRGKLLKISRLCPTEASSAEVWQLTDERLIGRLPRQACEELDVSTYLRSKVNSDPNIIEKKKSQKRSKETVRRVPVQGATASTYYLEQQSDTASTGSSVYQAASKDLLFEEDSVKPAHLITFETPIVMLGVYEVIEQRLSLAGRIRFWSNGDCPRSLHDEVSKEIDRLIALIRPDSVLLTRHRAVIHLFWTFAVFAQSLTLDEQIRLWTHGEIPVSYQDEVSIICQKMQQELAECQSEFKSLPVDQYWKTLRKLATQASKCRLRNKVKLKLSIRQWIQEGGKSPIPSTQSPRNSLTLELATKTEVHEAMDGKVPIVMFGIFQKLQAQMSIQEKLLFWHQHRIPLNLTQNAYAIGKALLKLIPRAKVTAMRHTFPLFAIWTFYALRSCLTEVEQIEFWARGRLPNRYRTISTKICSSMYDQFKRKCARLQQNAKEDQLACMWFFPKRLTSKVPCLGFSECDVESWAAQFATEVTDQQRAHMFSPPEQLENDVAWALACFQAEEWVSDESEEVERRRRTNLFENATALLSRTFRSYQLIFLNKYAKKFRILEAQVFLACGFVLSGRANDLSEVEQFVQQVASEEALVPHDFDDKANQLLREFRHHNIEYYFGPKKAEFAKAIRAQAQGVPDTGAFFDDFRKVLCQKLNVEVKTVVKSTSGRIAIRQRQAMREENFLKEVKDYTGYGASYQVMFYLDCQKESLLTKEDEKVFARTFIVPYHLLDRLRQWRDRVKHWPLHRETDVLCRFAAQIKLNVYNCVRFHSNEPNNYEIHSRWASAVLALKAKENPEKVDKVISAGNESRSRLNRAFKHNDLVNDYRYWFLQRVRASMTYLEEYVFRRTFIVPERLLETLEMQWLREELEEYVPEVEVNEEQLIFETHNEYPDQEPEYLGRPPSPEEVVDRTWDPVPPDNCDPPYEKDHFRDAFDFEDTITSSLF